MDVNGYINFFCIPRWIKLKQQQQKDENLNLFVLDEIENL